MATAAGEHRLQMRILFALALLGGLIALAFSQSAGLFTPPSIIAAGAQLPADGGEPVTDPIETGGQVPGTTDPRSGAGNVAPRTPATVTGGTPQAPSDQDGLGGPIETADASGAIPPSIAEDLATPPAGDAATPGGDGAGPNGPGIGNPGTSGPGGNVPGITGPGTGNGGDTDPNVPTPTTPVPEPATWLILIVGIAIVGGALRRRGVGHFASRQLARG